MFISERIVNDDVRALRDRITGEVVSPADAAYDQARLAWNLAADQRPGLVVFPESADDVVEIVLYARRNGLQIAPEGTGHNAPPIVWDADMLLLSTSRMRGVTVDPVARRARVAAGTVWLVVTEPASEHGLAPLAGSSPDVGVIGYCLDGGVSWLARKHGLANSVLAIEIVTADGRLRRVDAENDAALFWALRGGGGSFGVVTAMEIALHPLPELYAGAMFWDWEHASKVMHAWREWTATLPDEVTSSARILQLPPIPEVPEMLRGRSVVTVDAAIIGDRAFGAEMVRALRDLEPEIDMFDVVAPVALSRLHNDPEEPVPVITDHRLLGELTAEAIDAFVAHAGPGSGSAMLMAEIRHLGGALGVAKPGNGALAKLDAGHGLPQLRGEHRRLTLVLRRADAPSPGAHQDERRPGRRLPLEPPDRGRRVAQRSRSQSDIRSAAPATLSPALATPSPTSLNSARKRSA